MVGGFSLLFWLCNVQKLKFFNFYVLCCYINIVKFKVTFSLILHNPIFSYFYVFILLEQELKDFKDHEQQMKPKVFVLLDTALEMLNYYFKEELIFALWCREWKWYPTYWYLYQKLRDMRQGWKYAKILWDLAMLVWSGISIFLNLTWTCKIFGLDQSTL